MTATVTTAPLASEPTSTTQPVWKHGVVAGLAASAATTAVAVAARAIDVPVDAAGESIPIAGFAQLTLMCTAIGILLARVISRRSRQPKVLFTKVTVALTVLSLVPDLTLDAGTATKVTLILTHLVAAAIVIPALAGRLPERRARQ
jgi:peptidoglycan/LPS O-acetylase OafA/YrhL